MDADKMETRFDTWPRSCGRFGSFNKYLNVLSFYYLYVASADCPLYLMRIQDAFDTFQCVETAKKNKLVVLQHIKHVLHTDCGSRRR